MDEKQITKEFYEDIRKLVEESEKIYRLAEQEYAPMVDYYIETKCTDSKKIEKLLDDLLSCACDERILLLFKKLCRYYYSIDSEATIYYVGAYRRMWDEDQDVENEK
ncbi:hypothetical protein M2459_003111 [Parabacteroides sp. PF5-5]|uniref:hypothetical protein n=1 Tax=unclassified Parabacteroides TaxID=2649774 RepID=UPI00247596D1|nr:MULTISPECIES: hypothetical protein [unclassified Parabacteroides]MDH6305901.1 hypothetical protein [Parabacteroides sp. PH5-39]MDH6317286.1 hypothetical protein [Parabacteroides sp. PF5-13]MDH6320494.1 hypothetical protein [Parabacteroides sp. PH5-13]MDH6324344.1 hypothetical protein [Parabacteroides sp. PH5-8]MDH6328540.1 hypothetical protein [Parabacteroides sp. PH5-41]